MTDEYEFQDVAIYGDLDDAHTIEPESEIAIFIDESDPKMH